MTNFRLFQTLPDSSKLKEFADEKFKLDENGRDFSKLVENTVEKRSVFKRLVLQTGKNVWKRVKISPYQKVWIQNIDKDLHCFLSSQLRP